MKTLASPSTTTALLVRRHRHHRSAAVALLVETPARAAVPSIFDPAPFDTTDGRQIYEHICQGCHMPDARRRRRRRSLSGARERPDIGVAPVHGAHAIEGQAQHAGIRRQACDRVCRPGRHPQQRADSGRRELRPHSFRQSLQGHDHGGGGRDARRGCSLVPFQLGSISTKPSFS
jgi:hypothetical protein